VGRRVSRSDLDGTVGVDRGHGQRGDLSRRVRRVSSVSDDTLVRLQQTVGCSLRRGRDCRTLCRRLDESWVEEANVFEDLAADEQTAGRRELLAFEVAFDWKAGVVVVSGSERWLVGKCELNITAHVVGVGGSEVFEGGFEPVFGDGHVGVDEREDVAVGVSDSVVAGGIGGLNLAFVTEGYVVSRLDWILAQYSLSALRGTGGCRYVNCVHEGTRLFELVEDLRDE